jgi:hypothetical protein
MPSDTPIYRDGKQLWTSRRAYEAIYKPRGWRLRPPRQTPTVEPAGGEPGDQPTETEE